MIIWEEKSSFSQLLLHFYSFIQLFLSFLRPKKASEQLHISKKKRTFVKPKLRKLGRRMYKNPNQLILMSDLENKTQEEAPKKRPYNLREKKEKDAAYRSLIRPELADELYDKILNIIVVQKKYRDRDYSAKDLAKELETNTRYLSAVVNSRFGMNYSCLLNEYRVKEAMHLLKDKRYADKNVEEISTMVGFANRQSFYAAFYKNVGETPNSYRKRHAEKKK